CCQGKTVRRGEDDAGGVNAHLSYRGWAKTPKQKPRKAQRLHGVEIQNLDGGSAREGLGHVGLGAGGRVAMHDPSLGGAVHGGYQSRTGGKHGFFITGRNSTG